MNYSTFFKILGLLMICFIFPAKCLADMLPPPLWAPLFIPLAFCINLIVTVFFLTIAYLVLKRGKLIISLKFLKYIFLVVVGGFLIDLIYIVPKEIIIILQERFYEPTFIESGLELFGIVPIFLFLTILGIGFYNYWLPRKIFALNKKEAIFIGLVAAIFGSPISPLVHFPLISPLLPIMGF